MWGLNKVILSDGRQLPADDDLEFDSATYRFYYQNEDITNLISRKQKRALVAGFDDQLENNRINLEKGHGSGGATNNEPLDESTGDIFANQIITDPLAAPIEAGANAINSIISNPAYKTMGLLLLVGVGLFLAVKLSR